ncbi:helix-turn-helix domain-containing protein [Thalassospira xiamenensis]|uniref:Helix-turn-helix domain-containing protein n=1 Tax=Thalassospira xiamenensis TaxID=220697 RepID=A0A285TY39_9PROT|nr:helix-turn-helix domain-containing protein [Thalassospira xiamenensis]SOC30506.1 hypothetical protein SAMN05428964_10966 [Thalassospira xiamenensis]
MSSDLNTVTRWGKVPAWWLLHPDINADRFSLLAALATYADDAGICDPSQSTLAGHFRRSRPWVNKIIAELVEVGFLKKTRRARANGGMTSCRYRIVFDVENIAKPSAKSLTKNGPTDDTPCPPDDRGCHEDDRNQPQAEQSQDSPPRSAGARGKPDDTSKSASKHSGGQRKTETAREKLPFNWTPSPEVLEQAARLYPQTDLAEHTALFVARCRSKSYAIDADNADDTWLAWLIEDQRKQKSNSGTKSPKSSRRANPRKSPSDASASQLKAWGSAAGYPTS